MMAFRTVKSALETLLDSSAAGRYSVEGFHRQSHSAEEILSEKRHVSVFYRQGSFEKTRSGMYQGPFKHAAVFPIELKLAAPALADLTVLDPRVQATSQQRMSALSAMISAAKNADDLWDEVMDIVWNILMAPSNSDFIGGINIEDRWIGSAQKENPSPLGEYVILTGTMEYGCTINELPAGDVGVPAGTGAVDVAIDGTADITGVTTDSAKQGARSQ
jgi:hypothetical protein